jgi:hypothetical protein
VARIRKRLATEILRRLNTFVAEDGSVHLPDRIAPSSLLGLATEVGDEDLEFYDAADQLVWGMARRAGYPVSDPLEPKGHAKDFLAEFGVENVPQWYAQRGIPERMFPTLFTYSALCARDPQFLRRVIIIPPAAMDDTDALAPYIIRGLTHCLENHDRSDTTLFSI